MYLGYTAAQRLTGGVCGDDLPPYSPRTFLSFSAPDTDDYVGPAYVAIAFASQPRVPFSKSSDFPWNGLVKIFAVLRIEPASLQSSIVGRRFETSELCLPKEGQPGFICWLIRIVALC